MQKVLSPPFSTRQHRHLISTASTQHLQHDVASVRHPRHHPHHRVLRRSGARQLADDPAFAEDENPGREIQDLRQLARDQENGGPARRRARRSARVSLPSRRRPRRALARRRSAADSRAASHFVSTIFCWFPPESAATGTSSLPARTRSRSKYGLTFSRSAAPSMNPKRASRGENRERPVLEHAHRQHQALTFPILGHQADAQRDRLARGCVAPRGGRGRSTSPVASGSSPKMRARDLRSASADEPCTPDHLARAHRERHVREAARARQVLRRASSSSPAWRTDVRRKVFLEAAADHHLDERGAIDARRRLRGHVPAVAQHGHVIAQPEDLFEPMADVDAGDAALAQPADQLVEPLRFVLRQAARRLVEDDDRARRARSRAAICSICC